METVEDLAVDNPFAYAAPIWDLFRRAPRAGRFGAEAPGSVLSLAFQLDGGRVVDARFQAYGCPTSIAVGAWIADWAIGQPIQNLASLKAAQLRAALEIPDTRAHCALMGEDAVQAAVAAYQQELS